MSIQAMQEIVHAGALQNWAERNQEAFKGLFGGDGGRWKKTAMDAVSLRSPEMKGSDGVSYVAYIHPSNGKSGPYSGLSFVAFPVEDSPALIGMVVGTQGLAPDEAILGRPGHARKVQAICSWLNAKYGKGRQVAWAKQDPTRIDLSVPDRLRSEWSEYSDVFARYGNVVYALYRPTEDRTGTAVALRAFLDLMFEERGFVPLTNARDDAESLRAEWFEHLMPSIGPTEVAELLNQRKFVIVQGPPGTGKTKLAIDLLAGEYRGFGRSIQFHPNSTYETFIGGLAPVADSGTVGLKFAPARGLLMEAAAAALENSGQKYLLHIDEINRADLGKILGEAIFLFESQSDHPRVIDLPYDFGQPFRRQLSLPQNLHILGTMNSADRSIAIVDVAVRRRFAFVSLWPRMSVVESHGCKLMQEAFRALLGIFIEHASDDSLALMPGHSYFLEQDDNSARRSLRVNLIPLLEEYLSQGYASGFAEPVRGYLQWLRARI